MFGNLAGKYLVFWDILTLEVPVKARSPVFRQIVWHQRQTGFENKYPRAPLPQAAGGKTARPGAKGVSKLGHWPV